jgi:hypothetical protein
VGRVVVDLLGLHRANDADVVGDRADVGQEVADGLTRLAVFAKRSLWSKAQKLLLLQLSDRLALGERLGHRRAVHGGQLRLLVEQFKVRRPAGHAQEDDALGLWCEVQRIDSAQTARRFGAGAKRGTRQETRKRHRAQPERRPAEERSAGENCFRSDHAWNYVVHFVNPQIGFTQRRQGAKKKCSEPQRALRTKKESKIVWFRVLCVLCVLCGSPDFFAPWRLCERSSVS